MRFLGGVITGVALSVGACMVLAWRAEREDKRRMEEGS